MSIKGRKWDFKIRFVKQCKNTMCGSLIYDHQNAWLSDYCCDDCRQEVRHFESVSLASKTSINGRFINNNI